MKSSKCQEKVNKTVQENRKKRGEKPTILVILLCMADGREVLDV